LREAIAFSGGYRSELGFLRQGRSSGYPPQPGKLFSVSSRNGMEADSQESPWHCKVNNVKRRAKRLAVFTAESDLISLHCLGAFFWPSFAEFFCCLIVLTSAPCEEGLDVTSSRASHCDLVVTNAKRK
jgi:hypothetical protein